MSKLAWKDTDATGSPGHFFWGWQHRSEFSLQFVKDSHPEVTEMPQLIPGSQSNGQLVVKNLLSGLSHSRFRGGVGVGGEEREKKSAVGFSESLKVGLTLL